MCKQFTPYDGMRSARASIRDWRSFWTSGTLNCRSICGSILRRRRRVYCHRIVSLFICTTGVLFFYFTGLCESIFRDVLDCTDAFSIVASLIRLQKPVTSRKCLRQSNEVVFVEHQLSASSPTKDNEARETSKKAYDLCVQAANHISSIVAVYVQKHCPKRASVFLSFYVFTAAIMHMATRMFHQVSPCLMTTHHFAQSKSIPLILKPAWDCTDVWIFCTGCRVSGQVHGGHINCSKDPRSGRKSREHRCHHQAQTDANATPITSWILLRQPSFLPTRSTAIHTATRVWHPTPRPLIQDTL